MFIPNASCLCLKKKKIHFEQSIHFSNRNITTFHSIYFYLGIFTRYNVFYYKTQKTTWKWSLCAYISMWRAFLEILQSLFGGHSWAIHIDLLVRWAFYELINEQASMTWHRPTRWWSPWRHWLNVWISWYM